jgi:predicted DNA-binding protein
MPSHDAQPRHRRYSVRWQARLDSETHGKLQALAQRFHRKHAQILRYVMAWGLDNPNAWTADCQPPDRTHLVPMLIDPELCQRVQDAAAAHGSSVAAWVRQAMRHITVEDFRSSWRAGEKLSRSHDSGYFRRKFGLRLDDETAHKLEGLTAVLGRPAAEVIRQLIIQATIENFPESWRGAGARVAR